MNLVEGQNEGNIRINDIVSEENETHDALEINEDPIESSIKISNNNDSMRISILQITFIYSICLATDKNMY